MSTSVSPHQLACPFVRVLGSEGRVSHGALIPALAPVSRKKIAKEKQEKQGKSMLSRPWKFTHYEGKQWRDIVKSTRFNLAPRGYGRSSFRQGELIQMGVVPVYIWDDFEWLPCVFSALLPAPPCFVLCSWAQVTQHAAGGWLSGASSTGPAPSYRPSAALPSRYMPSGDDALLRGDDRSFSWSVKDTQIGYSVKVENFSSFVDFLKGVPDRDFQRIRANAIKHADSHFTYKGIVKQIARFFVEGPGVSDLVCVPLPESPRCTPGKSMCI